MASVGQTIPQWVRRRVCLSCGFAGKSLQADAPQTCWTCPRCGVDLYQRPPRSYAEMEGLDAPPEQARSRGESLGFVHLVAQPTGTRIGSRRTPGAERVRTLVIIGVLALAIALAACGAAGF